MLLSKFQFDRETFHAKSLMGTTEFVNIRKYYSWIRWLAKIVFNPAELSSSGGSGRPWGRVDRWWESDE